MFANRTAKARPVVLGGVVSAQPHPLAPRVAFGCRLGSRLSIGLALILLVLVEILPTVGVSGGQALAADQIVDADANGVEDILDQWYTGHVSWGELTQAAAPSRAPLIQTNSQPVLSPETRVSLVSGVLGAGRLRLLCLGVTASDLASLRAKAASAGVCRVLQDVPEFGGVTVLAVDEAGLRAFLSQRFTGLVMLDRDGVSALLDSRHLLGVGRVTTGDLQLGDDWSTTVAILDSGMDSAHGDLGDVPDDDIDGPPPAVGDATDWFAADGGWPLFAGYKVVGWHDVTDDFPASAGPWDYHYHGTALASVVAGSGAVDPQYRGVAAGTRLTIVKFYDFDLTWHAWAGDFLAACAWTLSHQDVYRIRTALMAVNWQVDAGISNAMAAFVDAGILPVVAVGNSGSEVAGPGFPARLADVLTVGAVNAAGEVSAYSTRGLSGQTKPDLVAPGGGLLATAGRIVAADIDPNDSYSGRVGTSLAAAHVAGAAALLDEVLRENGMPSAMDRVGVRARQLVLKYATAIVDRAESPDGQSTVNIAPAWGFSPERGFGLARIDAAVHALMDPLRPGQMATDTLTSAFDKPVVARRLIVSPGLAYRVQVTPTGSLDVALTVVEVRAGSELVWQRDQAAQGSAEQLEFRPHSDSWSFLVAQRVAGAGSLRLRLVEIDTTAGQGGQQTLPGVATGAPTLAQLGNFAGPSLAISSRVFVDPGARSLNVLDLRGGFRPGWPAFVFPGGGAIGGLSQPVAADLDGVPGDELVVSSGFGSVVFFEGSGAHQTVQLAFNRPLSGPVVIETALGTQEVAVVDDQGWVRTWSWNAAVGAAPELMAEVALGHLHPLDPAVGRLVAGGGESLVVSFADGWVVVLDDNLQVLSGWPRVVAAALTEPPVLCDVDGDGWHEIAWPVWNAGSGQLSLRLLDGMGNSLAGDGALFLPPTGGRWRGISGAMVSGRYDTGTLSIGVAGLVDNGLSGDAARWSLGRGRLFADGSTSSEYFPGMTVSGTTDQGVLTLDKLLLPTPLAWNQVGGGATEPSVLFHLTWHELLYGFASIPGATTGWLQAGTGTDPIASKVPLSLGGSVAVEPTFVGSLLVPLSAGLHLRVDVIDRQVGLMPVSAGQSGAAIWSSRRSDSRLSGAYPLRSALSPVLAPGSIPEGLRVVPNPGGGDFAFAARRGRLTAGASLEIYDLSGRRVRVLSGSDAQGVVRWDGTDWQGQPLAAGVYLAVAQDGLFRFRARFTLTH